MDNLTVTISLEEFKVLIEKAYAYDMLRELAEGRAENGYYISEVERALFGLPFPKKNTGMSLEKEN